MNDTQLVSIQLLREDDVQSRIEASIDFVRTSVPLQLISFVKLLQLMYRSNTLVSALGTNAVVYQGYGKAFMGPATYPFPTDDKYSRHCGRRNAVGPAFFMSNATNYYEENNKDWLDYYQYPDIDSSLHTSMEGFFGGCFPLDAVLASTLECFYDALCLKILPGYFPGFNKVCITCPRKRHNHALLSD